MAKGAGILDLDAADLELDRRGATLVEVAADKLREFILLEKLPPGAPISERDVAAALGISRTPLRAALAILEQDGLVEYSVTRRPKVADPSLGDIIDGLAVLGALEALAGELACDRASAEAIARVVALQERIARGATTLEPLAFFRTDMAFHAAIAQASDNRQLAETHARYNARLWRARFLSSRLSSGRHLTLTQHAEIAASLERRDGPATAAALKAHLASAAGNIASVYAGSDPKD